MLFLKKTKPYFFQIYKEISYRVIYFFFSFSLSCLLSWVYGKEILYIYLYPLYNLHQDFIFTSISEAFEVKLSLCFFLSWVLCLPLAGYFCFCFFSPSFFPQEKEKTYIICFWFCFSYVASLLFCYFFLLPELCSWFLHSSISTSFLCLSLQAKISTYFSWSKKMYIFCFFIFQIWVVFWFFYNYRNFGGVPQSISRDQQIKTFLFANNTYISMCILIFCACVSPPDIYSQGFLFFIFIVIYYIFLWLECIKEILEFYRIKKKENTLFLKH